MAFTGKHRLAGEGGARVELEQCVLFRGLPEGILGEIHGLATEREIAAETTIFCEGDPALELHILAAGEVELDYTLPNNPSIILPITRVTPGEVFAWSALANNRTLTARARTLSPCRVHVVPAAPLREILAAHPEAGYEVMSRLTELVASRLRDTRMQLRWLQTL